MPAENNKSIANAGLVLMWPYLNSLFLNLQLLNGHDFKDSYARQKAILYLHYLVWDQLPVDEDELMLNKIICGMDTTNLIDTSSISFTKTELSEILNIKLVMLKYWNVLKGTSAEGLTESFLKRKGSLNQEKTNWELNVASSATDILLAQLPWQIGVIKLPWNNYFIHVNW
ncbi:contractile injection system tape measure protein [Pedobacter aquatilis]|uniref:contractile injection system tape measure protein n=1 Tax=Pedobacter aquatilis TaxID=351343 RepID=UPI00293066D2|nr:contractile injection system tape measure protein [Pedobacter aquatilis]